MRIEILVFLFTFNCLVEAEYQNLCMKSKGSCRSEVLVDDEMKFKKKLIISCDCHLNPGADVHDDLDERLLRCPKMPTNDINTPMQETHLIMKKCSVEKGVFPVSILQVMRRSRNINIEVSDARVLRLNSTQIQGKYRSNITAKFFKSSIKGFGRGWFDKSDALSLTVEHCNIDVIESEFISFTENADTRIIFYFTNITTIKQLAFSLSPNASMLMNQVVIDTWEGLGYEGGRILQIISSKIISIGEKAFNVYGMHTFQMRDCIIGQIDLSAITEKFLIRGSSSTNTAVNSVQIIRNKFLRVHPNAFADLCHENVLVFQENFLAENSFRPRLAMKSCTKERDWKNSIKYNVVFCKQCFSDTEIDEQACAFYSSLFCFCGSDVDPRSRTQKPCLKNLYNYLHDNCYYENKNLIDKCQVPQTLFTNAFDNRTVYDFHVRGRNINAVSEVTPTVSLLLLAVHLSGMFQFIFS